jgi:hypothetical protein
MKMIRHETINRNHAILNGGGLRQDFCQRLDDGVIDEYAFPVLQTDGDGDRYLTAIILPWKMMSLFSNGGMDHTNKNVPAGDIILMVQEEAVLV